MSPYWKKIMEQQGLGDRKSTASSSSSHRGKPKRDSSTGRFKPRNQTFMVNSTSQQDESVQADKYWQGQTPPLAQPVVRAGDKEFHFFTGSSERMLFSWPRAARAFLAHQMIHDPTQVDHSWAEIYKGPQTQCGCGNQLVAQICTQQQLSAGLPPHLRGVTEPGWYAHCTVCTRTDTTLDPTNNSP